MPNTPSRGQVLYGLLAELTKTKRPQVTSFDVKGVVVDVLTVPNTPRAGVTLLATLSLSSKPAIVEGEEQDYGVELITFHHDTVADAVQPLVDAGCYVLANRDELTLSGVLPGLLERHRVSTTLSHFFLTVPSEFNGRLTSIPTPEREVRYLEATPISDGEMSVVAVDGAAALADLFDEQQIDRFDWNRRPVVDHRGEPSR